MWDLGDGGGDSIEGEPFSQLVGGGVVPCSQRWRWGCCHSPEIKTKGAVSMWRFFS